MFSIVVVLVIVVVCYRLSNKLQDQHLRSFPAGTNECDLNLNVSTLPKWLSNRFSS